MGREGFILLMTTSEPSKAHLGQCVGDAQGFEEQSELPGLPDTIFEEESCRGGVGSSLEDGLGRKGL